MTGDIQQAGVIASVPANVRRSIAFYEPYVLLLHDPYKTGLCSVGIARKLKARGIKSRVGPRWYPSIVLWTMRRAGITPSARPVHVELRDADVQTKGHCAEALQTFALAASYRGRIMPIIRLLRTKGLAYTDVATYLKRSTSGYFRVHRDLVQSATSHSSLGYVSPEQLEQDQAV